MVSYKLPRNLNDNEQLDFSTGLPAGQTVPSEFSKNPECAHFLYTASPSNGKGLVAGCYEATSVIVKVSAVSSLSDSFVEVVLEDELANHGV